MRKYLRFGLIVIMAIVGLIWFSNFKEKQYKDAEKTDRLINPADDIRRSAEQMRLNLPMKVDGVTTVTDMRYDGAEKKFVTEYEIAGIENLSQENLKNLTAKLRTEKIATARKSSNNESFINSGTAMEFVLKGEDGKVYEQFVITPEEMQ